MTTAGVEFTQQDGNLGTSVPSGRRPWILVGAADAGDYDTPVILTRKKQVTDRHTAGPLVKACAYFLSKGIPVIPIRTAADQTATCSAVTSALAASNPSVASIDPSHDTPNQTSSVKLLFPIGGTVGVAGIYWQVSYNGGVTYTPAVALGTASSITLTALGDVHVLLTHTGGSDSTIDDGGYATFSTTAIATGSLGTITDTVPGDTATLTHDAASTCDDEFEVEITFPTGGTRGTAGITYKYKLGPNMSWSGVYQLGTATSITLAGTGGIVIAVGAGTITAGRTISFRATAPGISSLTNALAAVEAYAADWEGLFLVGPGTAAQAAAIDAELQTLEAEPIGRDRIAIMSFRKPNVSESDSAYQVAFNAEFGGTTSTYGYVTVVAGSVKIAIDSLYQRREFGWAVAAAVASVDPGVDPSQRRAPGGALLGCTLLDADGNPDDHDESYTPGLADKRATCARMWSDLSGVYIEPLTRTFAAQGSDFALLVHRRVMNVGMTAVRTYMRDQIAIGIDIDATTGLLLAREVDRLNKGGTAVLRSTLRGMVSPGARVVFASDDVLNAEDSELNADVDIVPKFYPKKLKANIGLKSKLVA